MKINKIKIGRENISYYNDEDDLEIEVKLLVIRHLFLIIYFKFRKIINTIQNVYVIIK